MPKLVYLQGDLKDLSGRLDNTPTMDDIGLFVRWADLEDALKGIRSELEKLNQPIQPIERIVMDSSIQTEVGPNYQGYS
jgi:hypothetical protein